MARNGLRIRDFVLPLVIVLPLVGVTTAAFWWMKGEWDGVYPAVATACVILGEVEWLRRKAKARNSQEGQDAGGPTDP